MSNLLAATSPEGSDSASPSRHQLPVASLLEAGPQDTPPCHVGILADLILCRSCTLTTAAISRFEKEPCHVQKSASHSPPHPIHLLLHAFFPSSVRFPERACAGERVTYITCPQANTRVIGAQHQVLIFDLKSTMQRQQLSWYTVWVLRAVIETVEASRRALLELQDLPFSLPLELHEKQ